MRKIGLDEQHAIILDIAKEFDKVCTKYQIPYYMLGGTMLGAIRHKGFIPWDDDMDFGVPVEFYDELLDILSKELPSHLRVNTYKNSTNMFVPFAKLSDTRTILDDKQIPLPLDEKIGINIDIFPLYKCNGYGIKAKLITKVREIGGKVYTNSRTKTGFTLYIKKILRVICPFDMSWFIQKSLNLASSLTPGLYMANIFGRWKDKECCPIEWYGENSRYEFENILLSGVKEYDLYLKKMYGNYMKMPPTDQQFIHGENAYQK